MTKLELMAKVISKTIFRDGFSAFKGNNYLLTKLEHRIFRETMVAHMKKAAALTRGYANFEPCFTMYPPIDTEKHQIGADCCLVLN